MVLSHVNVAEAVHSQAHWTVKPRIATRPVRAPTTASKTRESAHDPIGRNFPDRVICVIRNIDIVDAVHCDPMRRVKPRHGTGPVCASNSSCKTSKCAHYPI